MQNSLSCMVFQLEPTFFLQCLLFKGAQPFDILAWVSNWVTNRKLKGKKLQSFEEAYNFGYLWLLSATCSCMQPMDCWLDNSRPVSSLSPYEIIHCWVLYACLTLWQPKKIDHFGSQLQSMVMVTWLPLGLWHGRASWPERKGEEAAWLTVARKQRKRQDRKWSRFQHPIQYYVLSDPTSSQ